jgi:hypothetical protein
MKKIYYSLLAICLFSCTNEKQPIIVDESKNHDYLYTKDLWISDESQKAKILLTINSDNQELFNEFNQSTLSLILVKSASQNSSTGRNCINNEAINSIPDISIGIKFVSMPESFTGFYINNLSTKLKGLNDYRYYEYYSNGCYGVNVRNDSNHNKDVRIGLLFTENQWFYTNYLDTNLPYLNDQCGVDLTGTSYYKIRVRVDGDGMQTVTFLYNAE